MGLRPMIVPVSHVRAQLSEGARRVLDQRVTSDTVTDEEGSTTEVGDLLSYAAEFVILSLPALSQKFARIPALLPLDPDGYTPGARELATVLDVLLGAGVTHLAVPVSANTVIEATTPVVSPRLARLIDQCAALGVPDDVFDDLVIDTAVEEGLPALNETDEEDAQEDVIGGAESLASDINNEGHAGQLAFLLAARGDTPATEVRLLRMMVASCRTA